MLIVFNRNLSCIYQTETIGETERERERGEIVKGGCEQKREETEGKGTHELLIEF
jgi:hypothetical protein